MRKGILLAVGLGLTLVGAGVAIASPSLFTAAEPVAPAAELKVGLGVEKMEITGEAKTFKVAAGTKIYAWTKVAGCTDTKITISFTKGDKGSKQELTVPRSPYRTNAYRTFRAGDEGEWTVKVVAADGKELASQAIQVNLEK